MLFDFLQNLFSGDSVTGSSITDMSWPIVNPATGLPMVGDRMGGVDVGGSPFGTDIHQSWDSGGSGMDWHTWD